MVNYLQTYKGLRVKDVSVSVSIDSETLRPVSFGNHLIDVRGVNTVPAVSEAKAIEVVERFVQSEAVKAKGYGKCEVIKSELVIARPNYDLARDKLLIPFGNPTLVCMFT